MSEKFKPLPGIVFIEPNTSRLSELHSQIEVIANKLGVQPLELQTPTMGFLPNPLSEEQEAILNQQLGPLYAQLATELQDRLTSTPVKENGEKMVFLPSLFERNKLNLSLSDLPFNEACGEWAGKPRVFWTRETVADRILKCGQALDSIGIVLHLEDAFRPMGVQEGLFLRRVKMIVKKNPEWMEDWDKIWQEARSKTAICPLMAGHKSGASIDLTLRRKVDNSQLLIGNIYPEGGPKVALHYPYITQEEWSNRQLFALTMEMAGLRTYPYEDWHASCGDLSAGIAAFSTKNITPQYAAIYGPLENFDRKTGNVQPYPKEEYLKPFFSQEELIIKLQK